jgi:hypothetical protein
MSRLATLKADTAVVVHVLGVDSELRVLLDQVPSGSGAVWTLPTGALETGQDPRQLGRALVRRAGAVPQRLDVVALESEFTGGVQRFDVLYECRAERMWHQPVTGGPLWWSLAEITSLPLAPRTRKAIIDRWASIWPHT